MHFRERNNVIQVIRSKYDADKKRGRTEIVGNIVKTKPEVSDKLRAGLSAAELKEVEAWLTGFHKVQKLKAELAAKTLGEQMALAGEWFAGQSGDEARMLAANLAAQWSMFRSQIKKLGLSE